VKAGQRLQRALVASYPPTFRRRYGAELTSLVEDNDARWRDSVDLALGVGRAWVAPVFGGTALEQRRSRLQTTTITVLAAWCASLLGAGAFSKAVDDPPLPGLHGAALTAYDVGTIVVEATAAAVLLAGFAFWLTVIVPALRRADIEIPRLRVSTFVAGLATVGIAAQAAASVVCMATLLHARDAGGVGPRDLVFSAGSVVVVVVVTAVAGVSVARGLGAIRGPSTT
jgi:hypothetical protein